MSTDYTYTYCETFWRACSQCCWNTCECTSRTLELLQYAIYTVLIAPIGLCSGCANGACSVPCVCECVDPYTPGVWNTETCKCVQWNAVGMGNEERLMRMYCNFGRNVGSLVHPYRFHRCISAQAPVVQHMTECETIESG